MKTLISSTLGAALLFCASQSAAQDRFADVSISVTPLNGSAYMLQGAGGNIGVSAGDDGVLIIEPHFITRLLNEILRVVLNNIF